MLATQAGHLEAEAELGGYVAEEKAETLVSTGRSALARMIDPDGLSGDDIALFGSATSAFAALLDAWRLPPAARVGVVAFEYARNAALLTARATRDGLRLVRLPVDGMGRLDLDRLDRHGPDLGGLDLATLPHVASHRGVVQPVRELAARCAAVDVPLLVDAAQSVGQVDIGGFAAGTGTGTGTGTAAGIGSGPGSGAVVWVGTSRKWLCGPRGVGFAAIGRDVSSRLHLGAPALTAARWPAAGLFGGEAAIAARTGWAQAVLELEAAGPAAIARRIADRALAVRRQLAAMPGWRVREPLVDAGGQPSGILTVELPDGGDPATARARLLADGVLTSAVTAERAPWEQPSAALRLSVHAWTTHSDIEGLAAALARL